VLPVGGAASRTFAPGGKNPRAATVQMRRAVCQRQRSLLFHSVAASCERCTPAAAGSAESEALNTALLTTTHH